MIRSEMKRLVARAAPRPGRNTMQRLSLAVATLILAVEVHQSSRSSSDLSFDLELVGSP
jgi:hypothetical protein